MKYENFKAGNLIDFIKTNYPDYMSGKIFEDDDPYNISNEWLIGTFAGGSFGGDNWLDCTIKLHKYFMSHIGHKSMVGDIVTESGYPNILSVKRYLKTSETEEE